MESCDSEERQQEGEFRENLCFRRARYFPIPSTALETQRKPSTAMTPNNSIATICCSSYLLRTHCKLQNLCQRWPFCKTIIAKELQRGGQAAYASLGRQCCLRQTF